MQDPVGLLHREQDLVQDPFRILDRTGSCQEKTWSVIPFRILTGSCQDPMSNQDPEGIDRILLRILSGSCQDPYQDPFRILLRFFQDPVDFKLGSCQDPVTILIKILLGSSGP